MFWLILVVGLTAKTTTSVVVPVPFKTTEECMNTGLKVKEMNGDRLKTYLCMVKP